MTLQVRSLGYLVPRDDYAGRVHSVFAHACNIDARGSMLTLVAADGDDAPAALRLAPGAPADLSLVFARGEPIVVRRLEARTPRVALSLAGARCWRPAPLRPLLPEDEIRARIGHAFARLAEHPRAGASVLMREGAADVETFAGACRDLDRAVLARCIDRLLGWGEGLTPAGDDFLVGALAALDALAAQARERRAFRDALAAHVVACLARTTPISAHLLRLAAGGHYAQALLTARAALVGDETAERLAPALDRALAIGATSGADTLRGLLHGAAAWSTARPARP
jgi:hypothetical protein